MITEEARIPDALGDAQPPVVLHGSGVLGVPLRVGGRGLSLVDEEAGHPARGEFDLQQQADGTAAHDQDVMDRGFVVRGKCRHGCDR